MARICYGVMGDARGHVSRALAIAQEMPHHEFLFIGGGKVRILKEHGYQVEEVPIFPTIIRNNRVDFQATVAHAIVGLVSTGPTIKRVSALIKEFDPHLILNDYESVTLQAAKFLQRPCVSLDNQHLLTHCHYYPPPGHFLNRFLTRFFIKHFFSFASLYLITSFHAFPPLDRTKTEVFPPLIKPKLREYQPSESDHVLVYSRGNSFYDLIKMLRKSKRKFVIYGLGERPPTENLFFKKISEEDFLADLASCRYVIGNGGHSLISEALYLGKPILCLPIHFFYEQLFNAHFLAQAGFGQYFLDISKPENLTDSFEEHLDHYRTRIKQFNFFGNKQITARLEELVKG
ncbi:MAG: glycosyltransferase family protein [Desulfuromonadaceae bacterium]